MAREVRRIYRELTPDEKARHAEGLAEAEADKEEILSLAKHFRAARREGAAALEQALRLLRSEREQQGLSLSDIQERTGIAKSNLSRLETDEHANPTIATLANYAEALGKKVLIVLADK